MQIDVDLWLKAASFMLSVGAMVYAFFANRQKDVNRRFDANSSRMDRHDARLSSLEQTVQAMPGKDDLHALQVEIVKLTGVIGEMRAVMEGNAKIMARLETIVTRHEDHLLNNGARK